MGRSRLEEEIEAATRQFVSKLVELIRSVSSAEVAALGAEPSKPRRPTTSVVGKPPQRRASAPGGSDLKERALATIRDAGRPIAAKSIADALSVPADKLAKPLKELRDAGEITKHGDKRATKYSL